MYKSYYPPSSFYEPPGYDDREDAYIYVGELEHMRHHFEAVLDLLYGKTYLNTGSLEFSLEEVAYGLKVAMPEGVPTVERERIDFCMCNKIMNTQEKQAG